MSEPRPPGRRAPAVVAVPLPFVVLCGLFTAALATCNLIANKFVEIDIDRLTGLDLGITPFVLSAGVLPYPLTFLVTDLLSEVYGRRRASQVVLAGFAALTFVLGALWLGDQFPAIADSPVDDAAYRQVFHNAWRVVAASMTAYLVAQFVDVQLYDAWKRWTGGRHLWLRNNASTVTSQLVDTTLVVLVLFAGSRSQDELVALVIHGWLFKIACALFDTPLLYAAVWWFRRYAPTDELVGAAVDQARLNAVATPPRRGRGPRRGPR